MKGNIITTHQHKYCNVELNSDIVKNSFIHFIRSVGVYFIKQILYCLKHKFDIEATGGHFKDGGLCKNSTIVFQSTREPFVVTLQLLNV